MGDVLGLHLTQRIGSGRPSVLVGLDERGRMLGVDRAGPDAEILALLDGAEADALVVDAPLVVPSERGRRDVEAVLSWCDVPAFPVAALRLRQVTGGTRAADLAPGLARPGRTLIEALPDQVLRQIAWERSHPLGSPPIDLGDYRAAWIGVRAPAYRPKGSGRARPEGVRAAWDLLAGVVDMGGWHPGGDAADDAAVLDALCCAYAGLRLARGEAVVVGTPERGRVAMPADANLRARVALTLARLQQEGTIAP